MTDREFLELAAKAAGISFFVDSRGREMQMHGGLMPAPWNPLADDGDALRLAVDCDMTVCADGLATVSASHGCGHDKVMVTQLVCKCGNDKSAATRRAIVRAAASIGKDMQ